MKGFLITISSLCQLNGNKFFKIIYFITAFKIKKSLIDYN